MRPLGWLNYTLLTWCILTWAAYSQTKVQLDEVAYGKGFMVYTGIAPINHGSTITDNDLSNLARDAFNDMVQLYTTKKANDLKYAFRGKHPSVMAALVDPTGERIYFSSSILSPPKSKLQIKDHFLSLGIVGTKVAKALEQCQGGIVIETKNDVQHAFKGSCGEVMLTVLFFHDRGEDAEIAGSRVVAVSSDKGDQNVQVKNFCTKKENSNVENSFGCFEYMDSLGILATDGQVSSGPTGDVGIGYARHIPICELQQPMRAKL
ncbi:hypothetical protein EJ04DRAFT_577769 [Polyplosphaeria fusca]|uniref:Uncharacterized protein n=1 Tax=Polyplosphaeria fusca TaxID=682080 RepID=A0A9P4QT00_9PLEO|nr:hypothetical protein EJ04DRAFT_577769 [Polyplosphaeria fusca]